MKPIPYYHVDAFASRAFQGNPAGVCLLEEWLPEPLLQSIAAEVNLSETAFIVWQRQPTPIRWFTPRQEVPLCGHATLAAGFVALRYLFPEREHVVFASESGLLRVSREGGGFGMELPSVPTERAAEVPEALARALDEEIVELLVSHVDPNYYAVLPGPEDVARTRPNLEAIAAFHPYGIAITAPGETTDFVTRYFAPGYGIPEDPVTGSVHAALAPYWSRRLGRPDLRARQLSPRPADLDLRTLEDRVVIGGSAVCFIRGEILLT